MSSIDSTIRTAKRSLITFKYLRRDGDPEMSRLAVVRRQLGECYREVKQARERVRTRELVPLASWVVAYHAGMFFHPVLSRKTSRLSLTLAGTPIVAEFRRNQSDLYILRENFVQGIYDFPYEDVVPRVRSIVDLGANIGLTSLYFQARFPDAHIVCVEPVQENVRMIHRNARNNRFDWTVETAAIQAQPGTVVLYPNEWWSSSTVTEHVATARQTKEGRLETLYKLPPEEVEAIPVDALLDRNHLETVDILKMDIEGAEDQVIAGAPAWLGRVRVLIIEIHDKYVDRARITGVLTGAGFRQVAGRSGPTDVFINEKI